MEQVGRHVFFVYESEHIPLLAAHIAAGEHVLVVALDYEVELDLKKAGIPFVSVIDRITPPEGQRESLEFTRTLARKWYTAPELQFFQYENILLGEQHEVRFLYYIQNVLYHLLVMQQIFAEFSSVERIYMPQPSRRVPSTADPTALFENRVLADVVTLFATQKGIPLQIVRPPFLSGARQSVTFLKQRIVQVAVRLSVLLLNFFITLLEKPRVIRLFALDPWSHIGPVVRTMKDVELIMSRRREIGAMGLHTIIGTRTRFHHRLDFMSVSNRKVRDVVQTLTRAWDAYDDEPAVSRLFEYNGISFWSVVKPALDVIIKEASADAVATIESTKKLCRRYAVNVILLFSSTKGYNNLVARIAERIGIPSIELQHGFEPTEPSFVHSRLPAAYLAGYGDLVRKHYESFGVAPERIIACGSPRFDAYLEPVDTEKTEHLKERLQVPNGNLNVLMLMPQIYTCLEHGFVTTYGAREFVDEIAELQRKYPSLTYLFRPHPGLFRGDFYEREEIVALFSGQVRSVRKEDLRLTLAVSDLVITGSSTVVVEAMIMRKPVLMYVPRHIDHDFDEYAQEGAVLMARTKEELFHHMEFLKDRKNREALVGRADTFLRDHFVFDGKAAERVAALIRKVTIKSNE